jgi:SAM-dependent methyltransferase
MSNLNLTSRFFSREDESPDENFYADPRFTKHIDDSTILNITQYYREVLKPTDRLLDLMSSWISHLPNEIGYRHVSGLGMNEKELGRNPRLDDYQVQNLNTTPALPYPDNNFDVVMIVVSIQYLTRPMDVFSEINRVLSPGGKCIVAMSHRLFPTKAIYGFQMLPPSEKCQLVSEYMSESNPELQTTFIDRSPPNADPLWLVVGTKPD